MPKMLADEDVKITFLASAPTDPAAIDATAANAGTDHSMHIVAPLNLGPTTSETVNMPAVGEPSNTQVFGRSNAEGEFVFFRYFDGTTYQIDVAEDAAFQAAKEKGTPLYVMVREGGKAASEDWAADDTYNYFEVTTDNPRNETGSGWRRTRVPLAVGRMELEKVVVAGV